MSVALIYLASLISTKNVQSEIGIPYFNIVVLCKLFKRKICEIEMIIVVQQFLFSFQLKYLFGANNQMIKYIFFFSKLLFTLFLNSFHFLKMRLWS